MIATATHIYAAIIAANILAAVFGIWRFRREERAR